MRFADLTDRFEKLRAGAGERVEALSAASTGWRMNRKVGLTFGAIGVAMAALALVTVGSLFVVRSSVGGVTDLSQANQALLRVQTQAVAAQGQLKDYVIRPDERLTDKSRRRWTRRSIRSTTPRTAPKRWARPRR